jgi:hypothetical protein
MRKKKQKGKPTYPRPLNKKTVVEFGVKHHSQRPMIFWEKAKVWDWSELLCDDDGKPNKELLLQRLSDLHIYFSDDAVPENKRSMAILVKVTIPTQREWLRLCEKYGYETNVGGIDDE